MLDKKAIGIYFGEANCFSFYPISKDIISIDTFLQPFGDDLYKVSLKLIINFFGQT